MAAAKVRLTMIKGDRRQAAAYSITPARISYCRITVSHEADYLLT